MKKAIIAAAVGVLLVAGQAAAAQNTAVRVGDRVGAVAGESDEIFAGLPLPVLLIGAAVVVTTVVVATDDDSESD